MLIISLKDLLQPFLLFCLLYYPISYWVISYQQCKAILCVLICNLLFMCRLFGIGGIGVILSIFMYGYKPKPAANPPAASTAPSPNELQRTQDQPESVASWSTATKA